MTRNLDKGETVGFFTTGELQAGSLNPREANGVNPDEMVTMILTLIGGNTLADVIAAVTNSSFRVGIEVRDFGPDIPGNTFPAESFVSDNHITRVPEPATLALWREACCWFSVSIWVEDGPSARACTTR